MSKNNAQVKLPGHPVTTGEVRHLRKVSALRNRSQKNHLLYHFFKSFLASSASLKSWDTLNAFSIFFLASPVFPSA
jgi:hypothetical protein